MDENPENPQNPPEGEGVSPLEAVETFLKNLARIIRLHKLYPSSHPFVQQGAHDALEAYTTAVTQAPGITIGHAGDMIMIDQQPLARPSQQAKDLVKRFPDPHDRPTRETFLNESGDDDSWS